MTRLCTSFVRIWIWRVSSRLVLSSKFLKFKVVVGFGLLEGRLAVLADHDERRQEDRFK